MTIPGGAPALFFAPAGAAAGYAIDRSLRFNSGDSAYLSFAPSSAGNRKKWTWSGWVKLTKDASNTIFAAGDSSDFHAFYHRSDGTFKWDDVIGGSDVQLNKITDAVFRDYSAFYHIVLSVDTTLSTAADRNRMYVNGQQLTFASGNDFAQNDDAQVSGGSSNPFLLGKGQGGFLSAYLADVQFVDGQALAPSDFTETDDNGVLQPKEYSGSYGTNGFHLKFADNSSNAALGTDSSGNSNTFTVNNLTAAGVDYASQAVLTGSIYSGAGDKTKMFDGTDATAGPGIGSYIDFTPSSAITINSTLRIKANVSNSSVDAIFQINNSNVSTVSTGFPANAGVVNAATTWTTISNPPSSLSHLRFGWASSGSWMSLAAIEIDGVELVGVSGYEIDSLVDTPEQRAGQTDSGAGGEVVGNYATFNPLFSAGSPSTSEGNLKVATSSSGLCHIGATIAFPTSGKWYLEVTQDSGTYAMVGVIGTENTLSSSTYIYGYAESYVMYNQSGALLGNNSGSSTGSGSTFTNGDCIGIALDMDNQQLRFYKNNTQLGGFNSVTTSKRLVFAVSDHDSSSTTFTLNAGQRAFKYAAPSNFKALCTANLPAPTIEDGSAHMDVALWTGQGNTNDRTITTSFNPDFVWIKSRSDGTYLHALFDANRGFGANNVISSNSAGAEGATDQGYIKSSTDSSITLGVSGGGNAYYNGNNFTYVAWYWDAGSSTVSNTDGSITSSVRASQTSGCSIVSWTGTGASATIGHGLNAAPEMIIVKCRSHGSTDWPVYHSGVGAGNRLYLSGTNSSSSGTNWNSTSPTSSVFSVGNNPDTNGSSRTYVAYCFAPVAGYSAIGKYTGNGSATDGPFVHTGFNIKLLMLKRTDSIGGDWRIFDTERDPYNVTTKNLFANNSDQESGSSGVTGLDILSNGFKLRASHSALNPSGGTYIYVAFASHPFKTARAT